MRVPLKNQIRNRVVEIRPGLGAPTKTYTLPTAPAEAMEAARRTLRENQPYPVKRSK